MTRSLLAIPGVGTVSADLELTFVPEPGLPPPVRQAGLGYTPDYVPAWERPLTLADGKADGLIPANALNYDGMNSLKEFFDRCLAMDVPGAIGSDIHLPSIARSYLARGLYGYGATEPTISTATSAGCLLHAYRHDVQIRGIRWQGFRYIVGARRKTLPLLKAGVLHPAPSHTGADPTYVALSGGSAPLFPMQRVGRLRLVRGFGSVTRVQTVRQLQGAAMTSAYAAAWSSVLDPAAPNLISQPVFGMPDTLAAAINGGTSGHGFAALADGDDVLLLRVVDLGDPIQLIVETSGSLIVEVDINGAGIDLSFCSLIDCNQGIGMVLDQTAAGAVTMFKNKGRGTWGFMSLETMRWASVVAANNEQADCIGTRKQPSGSSLTPFGTTFHVGLNSGSNHHAFQDTHLALENNFLHDIESANTTDTVNAAVGFDVRNTYERGKGNSISFNDLRNMTAAGSEDCNGIYVKSYGITIVGNELDTVGAAFVSAGARDGSECTGILIKECAAPKDDMPPTIVTDNIVRNPPDTAKHYVIKADGMRNAEFERNRCEPEKPTNLLRIGIGTRPTPATDANPGFIVSVAT